MPIKSKQPEDVYQEYQELSSSKSLKKVSAKKRLLIAASLILIGSFTNATFFNSSAATVKKTDAKRVVKCAYSSFLGRTPDKGGAKYWEARYKNSKYDPSDLGRAMLSTNEGQYVAYTTSFGSFISRMYTSCLGRPAGATATDISIWTTKHLNGLKREDIFSFVINTEGKPFNLSREEKCAKFTFGGSVSPVCKLYSGGYSGDVVTTQVSGSNIVVNNSWLKNVTDFRAAAGRAGFNLQANQSPGIPYSTGSFRTEEAQKWLRDHGYPVTSRETSMHQWGLAIDLSCNGTPIARPAAANCLNWVRNNAATFGIYNYTDEPWHWSSNGR